MLNKAIPRSRTWVFSARSCIPSRAENPATTTNKRTAPTRRGSTPSPALSPLPPPPQQQQ
eukprot:CAMPEP_0184516426 /NCGR_PEP_ID=MMETSP0198_2-20121128/5024_1 /TAXON_ID=1112570 /ORGANISM="Thraustochytrium sp., Strain LLF1b" /LENGTH=59 /DNA_ID=CAMNT_0026906749 /DNA_START=241 /DNA_END=417 /DNA_ORIENTATION=+